MPQPTAYPGATLSSAGNPFGMQGTNYPGAKDAPQMNEKPILGFLYSVSRKASGEYWPLHQGQNSIGRSASCAITLKEATVSDEHATIVITKTQKKTGEKGLLCYIKLDKPTYATLVNGDSVELEPVKCESGDIITISNYELYLILVDPDSLGLKPVDNLQPVEDSNVGLPVFGGFPPVPNKGTIPGNQQLPSSPFNGGNPGPGTTQYIKH